MPQPPQFERVLSGVSQPFMGLPSQLPKPALQLAIPQVPAVHVPVAFAGAHLMPQPPQFERVLSGVSQPFMGLPSQLPKPALQLAIPQVPIVHEGVPFITVQA
jgi:hypothetical protein